MKDIQSQLEELAQNMTSNTIRAFNYLDHETIEIILEDGSSIIVRRDDFNLEIFYAVKPKSTIVMVPKPTAPKPRCIEPDYFEHFNIPINDPDVWHYDFSKEARDNYLNEEMLLGVKNEILHWTSMARSGIPFNKDDKQFPLPKKMSEYRAHVYIACIYGIAKEDIKILKGIENDQSN